MPNYCRNTLQITGSDIPKFIIDHKINILDTDNTYEFLDSIPETYIPLHQRSRERIIEMANNNPTYMEELEMMDDDIYEPSIEDDDIINFGIVLPRPKHISFYQWNNKWWDTKWNACEPELVSVSEDELNLAFDTAWSPPINWVKECAKYYPNLKFELEYSEPGCDFYGLVIYSDGEEQHNESSTYVEFLLSEPGLPKLIKKIKKIPLKYDNVTLDECISLFEKIKDPLMFESFEEITIEGLTDNEESLLATVTEIWEEYYNDISEKHYDLKYNFGNVVDEIIQYYKALKTISKFIIKSRLERNIKKWSKLNKINKEVVEFSYLPEFPEHKNTIYERGGYNYQEAKSRFYGYT